MKLIEINVTKKLNKILKILREKWLKLFKSKLEIK